MIANFDITGSLHIEFTDKELETFTEENKNIAIKCAADVLIERDKTNVAISNNYTQVQMGYINYMNGLPYSNQSK